MKDKTRHNDKRKWCVEKLPLSWRVKRTQKWAGLPYPSRWSTRHGCRSHSPASRSTQAGRHTRLHRRWPWCPYQACCHAASWTRPHPPAAQAWSVPGPTCVWPPPRTEPGRLCRLPCARSRETQTIWSRKASGSHAVETQGNVCHYTHTKATKCTDRCHMVLPPVLNFNIIP